MALAVVEGEPWTLEHLLYGVRELSFCVSPSSTSYPT